MDGFTQNFDGSLRDQEGTPLDSVDGDLSVSDQQVLILNRILKEMKQQTAILKEMANMGEMEEIEIDL